MFKNKRKKMKINKLQPLVIVSALVMPPVVVNAETFSYTFISASYEIFSTDIEGIPEDFEGDSLSISGAFDIANGFGISAGYDTGSADVTSGGVTANADFDGSRFGAFFHTAVSNAADFLIGAEIIKGNVDIEVNNISFPSEDADGNAIFAGVRAMAATKVELNGFISRTKIEGDSTTSMSFGASYYIDQLFSIDAGYSFDKDGDSLRFGATKYF